MKHDDSELRVPVAQLALPVAESRDRGNHEGGAVHAAVVQAPQERHHLDGFPEAHLIAHDPCNSCESCMHTRKRYQNIGGDVLGQRSDK